MHNPLKHPSFAELVEAIDRITGPDQNPARNELLFKATYWLLTAGRHPIVWVSSWVMVAYSIVEQSRLALSVALYMFLMALSFKIILVIFLSSMTSVANLVVAVDGESLRAPVEQQNEMLNDDEDDDERADDESHDEDTSSADDWRVLQDAAAVYDFAGEEEAPAATIIALAAGVAVGIYISGAVVERIASWLFL